MEHFIFAKPQADEKDWVARIKTAHRMLERQFGQAALAVELFVILIGNDQALGLIDPSMQMHDMSANGRRAQSEFEQPIRAFAREDIADLQCAVVGPNLSSLTRIRAAQTQRIIMAVWLFPIRREIFPRAGFTGIARG